MASDSAKDSIEKALNLAKEQQHHGRDEQSLEFLRYIVDKYTALDESQNARRSSLFGSWTTPLAIALTGLITIGANFVIARSMASDAAKQAAAATRTQFQYKVLETELNSSRNEIDRAKVLLFLTKIGVLTELREDELIKIASVVLPEPNKIGVPALSVNRVREIVAETSNIDVSKMLSDRGIELIMKYEVPSATVYQKITSGGPYYSGFGGVEVGFGYDLRRISVDKFVADWGEILPSDAIAALSSGIGLSGDAARAFVGSFPKSITITYEHAAKNFVQNSIVGFSVRLIESLPEVRSLSPDCFSSVLSLAIYSGFSFNRGNVQRSIKESIVAGREQELPALFRALPDGHLWAARKESMARVCEHLPP